MANDKFVMSARQAAELDLAFERNAFTPAQVKELSKGYFLSRVREVLENQAEIRPLGQLFGRDVRKEGWKLIGTKPRRIQSIADLEPVSFFKKGESYVGGEEMLKRATHAGNDFGQEDAEFILERQKEIPKEWRSYHLVFPGTIWQDSNGDRRVLCLCWPGRQWGLGFNRLAYGDWRGDDRLLALRK